MKLYLDQDSREVRATAVGPALSLAGFTRNATEDIALRFVQDGAIVEPSGSFSVYLCLKSWGVYDEDPPLVLAGPLTKSGTGTSAVWSGTLLAASSAIDDVLEGDDEITALPAMLEIVRVYSSTERRTARLVDASILNNAYRGDESGIVVPAAASLVSLPLVTRLTGGLTTDLDGQDTSRWAAGTIAIISYGDARQDWKLRAKAEGEVENTDAGLVVPDDSSTLIWVKIGGV